MRDKSSFYLNQIYVTNLNEQRTYLTSYTGEFKIPAKVGDVIRFTSIVSERKDIKITPQLLLKILKFNRTRSGIQRNSRSDFE